MGGKAGRFKPINPEEVIQRIHQYTFFNAFDLNKVYTWLDAGTANQRVAVLVYSSVAFGFQVTETFSYNLVSGKYILVGSTRAVVNL